PSKIPAGERFDPERLALDLHRAGTKASYTPEVEHIVKQLAASAAPGDVVCVLSSGSFDNLHDRLLDKVGLVGELARDAQYVSFFLLRNERGLAGTVALEVLGEDAILRALSVDPEARGIGYGWMLAEMAISEARRRGVRRIYLVTESASDFFAAKFGFRVVDRTTISKQVVGHETFSRPTS